MDASEERAKPDAKPGPPEAAHSAETPQARRWRLVRYVVLCCMAAAAWRWLQSCAGVMHCKVTPPAPKSFRLQAEPLVTSPKFRAARAVRGARQGAAAYLSQGAAMRQVIPLRGRQRMRMDYTCLKDRKLHGACLPAVPGGCPLKGVQSVRKCKEQCDAAAACTALLYNRYGECYLHAGDDIGLPVARQDGATHKTVLCSKATYP